MKAPQPLTSERLFTGFVDPVDATLCVPANTTAAQLQAQTATHHLRFPLLADPAASLAEHFAAATHAPASHRFGAHCDNVLGINWRLPSGHTARIGERVVKTTTGYDWLRFLLHSGSRFGEPLDYVLRLRPDSRFHAVARIDGSATSLHACLQPLLRGGWMHWWDAVDYIAGDGPPFLRIAIHCPPHEADAFQNELSRIASQSRAQLTFTPSPSPSAPSTDGLPDIVLKTTPDRTTALADALARHSVRCVALCYSGVVHAHLPPERARAEHILPLIQPLAPDLHALGGDWRSRHLPPPPPATAEAAWLRTLEDALHAH